MSAARGVSCELRAAIVKQSENHHQTKEIKMKKTLAFLLTTVLLLSSCLLTSCTGETTEADP